MKKKTAHSKLSTKNVEFLLQVAVKIKNKKSHKIKTFSGIFFTNE